MSEKKRWGMRTVAAVLLFVGCLLGAGVTGCALLGQTNVVSLDDLEGQLRAADTDGNGSLSFEEIGAWLSKLRGK